MFKYKPITQGQRNKKAIPTNEISTDKPHKQLLRKSKKITGVNNQGKKTTRHKGGGVKRKYRVVDIKRIKVGESYKVLSIEYDPNRSAYVSLVCNKLGKKIYILSPNDIKVGDIVSNTDYPSIKTGDCTTLDNIPLGSFIHNIELKDKKGFQLCRAAGTYATVIAESEDQAIDILYDRFRDSKEVLEHLKTSTDWFTDPRHSEIAKAKNRITWAEE